MKRPNAPARPAAIEPRVAVSGNNVMPFPIRRRAAVASPAPPSRPEHLRAAITQPMLPVDSSTVTAPLFATGPTPGDPTDGGRP